MYTFLAVSSIECNGTFDQINIRLSSCTLRQSVVLKQKKNCSYPGVIPGELKSYLVAMGIAAWEITQQYSSSQKVISIYHVACHLNVGIHSTLKITESEKKKRNNLFLNFLYRTQLFTTTFFHTIYTNCGNLIDPHKGDLKTGALLIKKLFNESNPKRSSQIFCSLTGTDLWLGFEIGCAG